MEWELTLPNDLYSIYIPNHQLNNVRFFITDDKERSLPVTSAQKVAHNLNFKMTFKFEILRKRVIAPPPPLPYIQNERQLVDLRNDRF